jgi:hypothetical protein
MSVVNYRHINAKKWEIGYPQLKIRYIMRRISGRKIFRSINVPISGTECVMRLTSDLRKAELYLLAGLPVVRSRPAGNQT